MSDIQGGAERFGDSQAPDPFAELDQLRAGQFQGQMVERLDPFIALPDTIQEPGDFAALADQETPPSAPREPGRARSPDFVTERRPRYRQSHVLPMLSGMPTEAVDRLQRRMEDAGFIDPGAEYRVGYMDDVTITAFQGLLGFSNREGVHWAQGLALATREQKERIREQNADIPTSTRPFRPSDPAEVQQNIRRLFRDLVGREPQPSELSRFASQFAADERDAHQAAVEAAETEQRIQAAQQADVDVGQDPQDVTVPDFNPTARAIGAIERAMEPEISLRRRREEGREVRDLTASTASNLTRLTGSR